MRFYFTLLTTFLFTFPTLAEGEASNQASEVTSLQERNIASTIQRYRRSWSSRKRRYYFYADSNGTYCEKNGTYKVSHCAELEAAAQPPTQETPPLPIPRPETVPTTTVSEPPPTETVSPHPEETSTPDEQTPAAETTPPVAAETPAAPDNIQKYCKRGSTYYFESECKRRNLEANFCLDSKFGYHPCGTDPQKYVNLQTTAQANNPGHSGNRGSCGPGIYVGTPITNGVRSRTRAFGTYKHPVWGTYRKHHGWDYPSSKNPNKTIKASAGGIVKCFTSRGGGKTVEINHGGGLSTRYLHLASRNNCGKRVSRGTKIGIMGNTGTSTTGRHLHFEVRCNGVAVNPINYVGISVRSADDSPSRETEQ